MKLQREKLGDRKSEITILIDNDKITRLFPNINNQLRYQRKRQQSTSQPTPQNQPSQQSQQNPNLPQHDSFAYGSYNQEPQKEVDEMMDILKKFAGENEEHEEEHLESDWCGFFTRNKQWKVEVDFHCIHREPVELETVLNVAYRADLEESLSR